MLVREVSCDAKTGVTTERWVEMPDVVTPEAQAVVDAANAQAAQSQAANESTLNAQLEASLAGNATFLAIATPTAAQVAAQVKALTRQSSGQIRLRLRRLETADPLKAPPAS